MHYLLNFLCICAISPQQGLQSETQGTQSVVHANSICSTSDNESIHYEEEENDRDPELMSPDVTVPSSLLAGCSLAVLLHPQWTDASSLLLWTPLITSLLSVSACLSSLSNTV